MSKLVPELRFKGFHDSDFTTGKLKDICDIRTGKLNANCATVDGKYRFYTCSKNHSRTNTYSFDTEALLIAGNGNVGHINYYKGKFDAYQRTYVLSSFEENIVFIRYLLERNLKSQVNRELKSGVMPYIVLSTLADIKIKKPGVEEQERIGKFLSNIDKHIELEEYEIEKSKEWKKGLLQRMFV